MANLLLDIDEYRQFFREMNSKIELIKIRRGDEVQVVLIKDSCDICGPIEQSELRKMLKIVIMMIFFSMGLLCFRSPGYVTGWGDSLQTFIKLKTMNCISDSVAAIFICFILILLPCPKKCRKLWCNPRVEGSQDKITDEMKERRTGNQSRLLVTWDHMSGQLPWSYIFVLGGAIALATSCKEEYSNTNEVIVEKIKNSTLIEQYSAERNMFRVLSILVVVTVVATQFISNIVVAIVGVIFVMDLAFFIGSDAIWCVIAVQFSASFGFMFPISTPGNHIVHKEAKVPILSMMCAGLGPTIFSIIFMVLAIRYYAPRVWPLDALYYPPWMNRTMGAPKNPYAEVSTGSKIVRILTCHWRGIVAFVTPIISVALLAPLPPEKFQYTAYCLVVMAVYWVTECIPLQVTSFLPVVIFPLSGVMSTRQTCMCYMNDTIIMFLGSIMLASAVEQSGFHKRLALNSIRIIGYSHYRMLFAVSFITMFISMWITNTAATTMMVPIVFALLRVYESLGLLSIFEKTEGGDRVASQLTSCYFCSITFAATIGGIGTLVGTATNLVFKGLFMKEYPSAPEYLSFPLFSAFAIPLMLVLNIWMYIYMLFVYMGLCRPNSPSAKSINISPEGIVAAKKTVDSDLQELGPLTCHEGMVIFLFTGAMVMFFCRSPQIFHGWGDFINKTLQLNNAKYIQDSAPAMFVCFLMLFLPSSAKLFKSCAVKHREDLPVGTVTSVINWETMNNELPWSFIFLLGGGIALSTAAKPEYSNLNGVIGNFLSNLSGLPNPVILLIIIIFTVFVTNFASNVAVANVLVPIAMNLAVQIKQNPLWYNLATGLSASFCFMLPVGTPGNLIVQSSASVPTGHMIVAGFGPTITTVIFTWLACYLYAPLIWPSLHTLPSWVPKT